MEDVKDVVSMLSVMTIFAVFTTKYLFLFLYIFFSWRQEHVLLLDSEVVVVIKE